MSVVSLSLRREGVGADLGPARRIVFQARTIFPPECIVGTVPDIIQGNLTNHDGPYGSIEMGCSLVSQVQKEAEPAMQSLLDHGKGLFHQIVSHFHNFVL